MASFPLVRNHCTVRPQSSHDSVLAFLACVSRHREKSPGIAVPENVGQFSSTKLQRVSEVDAEAVSIRIQSTGEARTTLISGMVCENPQCLGAVRGVFCIDQ